VAAATAAATGADRPREAYCTVDPGEIGDFDRRGRGCSSEGRSSTDDWVGTAEGRAGVGSDEDAVMRLSFLLLLLLRSLETRVVGGEGGCSSIGGSRCSVFAGVLITASLPSSLFITSGVFLPLAELPCAPLTLRLDRWRPPRLILRTRFKNRRSLLPAPSSCEYSLPLTSADLLDALRFVCRRPNPSP
jgi:hypothetical protein